MFRSPLQPTWELTIHPLDGLVSQLNYEESRLWLLRCDNRSDDPQVEPIQPREGLDECHDATKENGASSNTPHGVGIEDKLRHKQDRDIE